MSNKTIGLAFLAGVAIGAGIGVLLAPDKGSKTREKIKGNIDDAKNDLKDKYDQAKKKAQATAEESYGQLVSNLSSKSYDVISFLEGKLAALKKEVAGH